MRKICGMLCGVLLGLAAGGSVLAAEKGLSKGLPKAGPAVVVDTVQAPAWLMRQGRQQPLRPGDLLVNHDRLLTGAAARVRLQLADGSSVNLGENTRIQLNALGRRDDQTFTAAIDLAHGAVRLSTPPAAKPRQQRAINVRVASLTVATRGADVWAKADGERDLVWLLAGQAVVLHAQAPAQTLSEANSGYSAYAAASGQAPVAITPAAAEAGRWLQETALEATAGASTRDGVWRVCLDRLPNQAAALARYDQVRAAGFAARVHPRPAAAGSEDAYDYEVAVEQLASEADARNAARRLQALLSLAEEPGVSR